MSHLAKVSVLMPAFNAEKTISYAINSVLEQSYCDWELLVIDDGSSDNTRNVVLGLGDPRIKLLTQANQGPSAARNLGIEYAEGEYITFIDADDLFHKDYLAVLVNIAEENNADITMCNYIKVESDFYTSATKYYRDANLYDETISFFDNKECIEEMLYKRRIMPYPFLKLIKKQVIGRFRFSEYLKLGEDLDFNWKILDNAHTIAYIDRVLYFHVNTDSSITHNINYDVVHRHFCDLQNRMNSSTKSWSDAVTCRMFVLSYDTLSQISHMDNMQTYYEDYIDFIQKSKMEIIHNPKVSFLVKVMGVLSNVSIPLTIKVCSMMKHLPLNKAI